MEVCEAAGARARGNKQRMGSVGYCELGRPSVAAHVWTHPRRVNNSQCMHAVQAPTTATTASTEGRSSA